MSRVPRLLSGQHLASVPLTPSESYLVSQIDANVSELDLAFITGMTPEQVTATLDRLRRAGAIEFVGEANQQRSPDPPPAAPPRAMTPAVRPSAGAAPGQLYDPAELDEAVDLDLEKKRKILELYYQLDKLTYYQLLKVEEPISDKKQVKNAYYALAPEFHPDKYFRKNLGSFKAKIEAVFARLTLAHDVLANAKRRAEYDDYIAQMRKNEAMSAAFDSTESEIAAIEAALQRAVAEAVAAAQPSASGPAPVSRAPVTAPASSAAIPADEATRLRREALARKLTGGARRPMPPPAPAPPKPAYDPQVAQQAAARAAEALRQRHEAAVNEARRQQVGRLLETGKTALSQQDFAGAANAFRIASSLEPNDPKVQAICNDALQRAAIALADGYWKQAAYEEGQERWAEAALSYSKVCAGRPEDAAAHERVAYTTLRAAINTRRAVEFARKAVELAPRFAEYRITLARAYLAAGLAKSCFGELDRALELSGGDAKIQTMAQQVRALAASSTASTKEGKVS